MKRVILLAMLGVFLFSATALAGGDQVCGDKATGAAGETGAGKVEQNRVPSN